MRPGTVSILTPKDGIAQLWSTSLAVNSSLMLVSAGSTTWLSTSSR